jgi:hypothetical protein
MQNIDIETWKQKYIETLSPKELKSYRIAKDHLGMSFQLEKSVGFIKWLKEQQINAEIIQAGTTGTTT